MPLAFTIPPQITGNIGWIVAGLLVIVTFSLTGLRDVARFSLTRVWAISGVCFREAIRRRTLWVTPLAILGVIVVSQLQKPMDEQDAIRQTTKFCLFATGLLVTITIIILACTNLPREIDNRVIFTVVTKPTTRLEVVLGKIIGFARVSAAILTIMGLFTWGYLHLRAWSMERDIALRLDSGTVDAISRPSLEHYRKVGLLNAKSLASVLDMQVLARVPKRDDPLRWFQGEGEGFAAVPFRLPDNIVTDPNGDSKTPALIVTVRVAYESMAAPTTGPINQPTPLLNANRALPQVVFEINDQNQNSAIQPSQINDGKPVPLVQPGMNELRFTLNSLQVEQLKKLPLFFVIINGVTANTEYAVDDHPATITFAVPDSKDPVTIEPLRKSGHTTAMLRGKLGNYGERLRGESKGHGQVAVYHFDKMNVGSDRDVIPIEMRVGIERGGDTAGETENLTRLSLQVYNRSTGLLTDASEMLPENNRTAFTTVPVAALAGGSFDILVRCSSDDQWIGLTPRSLFLVNAESTFGFNLIKSLLVMWMLTVLVIAIAILCSTFLSWPIAVVLTLVILLAHWGVQQLGDAASAGLGRQFVTDVGLRDPAQAQALSSTVEGLNKLLNTVATVLPDVGQFSATEDIEQGISLPAAKMQQSLFVLLGFGLPATLLAYAFLKNKEVAP